MAKTKLPTFSLLPRLRPTAYVVGYLFLGSIFDLLISYLQTVTEGLFQVARKFCEIGIKRISDRRGTALQLKVRRKRHGI
jgi:hypothetical protein